MSQQRVHVPDASLPSPGSARAIVPPLHRYYQGTATSCRPSRRASFPSLGGTTGSRTFRSRRRCVPQRRAWGWSPGIPVRDFFRGNDRISQVPGEPQFPFAHGLRPRPVETSLTDCRTLAWPPMSERRRHRRLCAFRGSIAWLSGSPPTYHALVSRRRARLASRCWSGFPGRASTRRVPTKGFNSLHVGHPPLPSFLAQSGRHYALCLGKVHSAGLTPLPPTPLPPRSRRGRRELGLGCLAHCTPCSAACCLAAGL